MSPSDTSKQPLVAVEDIHTFYGKSHILNGVSLQVGAGEVVGLLGRNGVGKSTTLKTIMGLVSPSQGRVLFEGKPVSGMPSHKLARLGERRAQAGGTLSGGEQQMLAIARVMMLEPKIVLLDEPTEGLMPRMVSQIREIIDVLHQEGVAILLVEQNVPLTLESSQRVYFMEKGAVRHQAAASTLTVNDPVIHQYLGV